MLKVAVIIQSGLDSHESRARVHTALHTVKELKDAGDHVTLVFEGAGTRSLVQLNSPGHMMYDLFKAVEETVSELCRFCANQFHVTEDIEKTGLALSQDPHNHPSMRNFLVNGYEIVVF